jgi:hypothetical protein
MTDTTGNPAPVASTEKAGPLKITSGPVMTKGYSNGRYLGRVIIEVWDNPAVPADKAAAWGLAYTYTVGENSPVNAKQLCQRVAEAFPIRFMQDRDLMED